MAIKKIIEIDVDQVQAMGGLDALKTSLDNVEKKTASLKSEYRKAQQEVAELSDKFGATSKQAIDAAKRASELADKIGDAKNLTDAFNPDAKFKSLTATLGGVASGFSAYQGALGLAGVESKELEKQLLQVQSAMALSQGLQGLGEAKDSLAQLKAVAINTFNGIKAAIGSTGIGLLVIALGSIVTFWDDIKEAVNGVSDEQKQLNKAVNANAAKAKENLSTLNSQDETLKRQGKTEREILVLKQKQTQEAINQQIIAIQNNIKLRKISEETAQRNKEILKSILDFVAAPVISILKGIDAIGSRFGKTFGLADKFKEFTANLVFNPDEVRKKGEQAAKEEEKILEELINQRDGYANQIKAIDKKASDDRINRAKEEAKVLAELLKRSAEVDANLRKEVIDAIEQAQEKNNEFLLSSEEAEIQRVNEKYFRLIELAKQFGLDTINLEIEQANAINDIRLKTQAEEDKVREENRNRLNESIALELNARQAFEDAKFNIANQGLDLLSGLFGKSKGIAKGILILEQSLAIGQVITNASRSIAQATANLAAVPAVIGVAPNPLYAVQAAATAKGIATTKISAGISIANILAQTVGRLSSSGVSGGGSQGSSSGGGGAPQFNLVGNNATNQLTATIAGQQNQPIQTYVVGSQVTSQQALDRNAVANSVFG